jgi:small subunit ribosomal protein S20
VANHKSALKRAGQNEVRRLRNRGVKTRVKNVIKAVQSAKAENPDEVVNEPMIKAQSAIDQAAKKGVLHKRTAARKVSRLAKIANATQS